MYQQGIKRICPVYQNRKWHGRNVGNREFAEKNDYENVLIYHLIQYQHKYPAFLHLCCVPEVPVSITVNPQPFRMIICGCLTTLKRPKEKDESLRTTKA